MRCLIILNLVISLFFCEDIFSQKITIFSSGDTLNNSINNNHVEIGYLNEASIGLDTFLGEELVDELETNKNIIAIQRDLINYECLSTEEGELIYFENAISLNNDLRSLADTSLLGGSFFQVKILSEDITEVIIVQPEDNPLNDFIEYLAVVSNCGTTNEKITFISITPFNNIEPTFVTIEFNPNSINELSNSSILIKMRHEVPTSYDNLDESNMLVFPNPTSDVVYIQSEDRIESWEVFSNTGQFIDRGNTESINVSNYINGLYYVKIYDGSQYSIHKMIKIE